MKRGVLFLACILLTGILHAQTIRYVKMGGKPTGDAANANSWQDACEDLQAVIDASKTGDIIWVAAGTYKPSKKASDTTSTGGITSDKDKAFLLKDGVKVYGGFEGVEATGFDLSLRNFTTNKTILTGKLTSTETAYHVVVAASDKTSSVFYIDGFTITEGHADGSETVLVNGKTLYQNGGGGLYVFTHGTITIVNNTITNNNAAGGAGGALKTEASGNIIVCNNIIVKNTATSYGGGLSTSVPVGGNITFANNTVVENSISSTLGGAGIYMASGGGTITFNNMILWGNKMNEDINSINSNSSGTMKINNSLFEEMTNNDLNAYGSGGTNNINAVGITTDNLFQDVVDYRLKAGSPAINKGTNTLPAGIYVDKDGKLRIQEAKADLGAYEYGNIVPALLDTIIYVNKLSAGDNTGKNWENAFVELADAVYATDLINKNKIKKIKQIWVAAGKHTPKYEITEGLTLLDKTFLLPANVAVYGGFKGDELPDYKLSERNFTANTTTLSGALNTDTVFHVAVAIYGGITLDGFTITEGKAYGLNTYISINKANIYRNYGGGLFIDVSETETVTITNNLFANNKASNEGGSLYLRSSYAGIITKNNTFTNSYASKGGAVFIYVPTGGDSYFMNNIIHDNNADEGAGFYAYSSVSTWDAYSKNNISNNIIYKNTASSKGGAGYMYTTCKNNNIFNNVIFENNADLGGGIYIDTKSWGDVAIFNNLIKDNQANTGGGIYANAKQNWTVDNGALNITGNTVVQNKVTTKGSGLFVEVNDNFGRAFVNNMLVWDNKTADTNGLNIEIGGTKVITVNNSLVQGYMAADLNLMGTNNGAGNLDTTTINYNNLFIDTANFYLSETSPAINKGNNTYVANILSTDLKGNKRINNGAVDLGAYEYTDITSVEISSKTLVLYVREESTLTAEIQPGNIVNDKLIWISSDTNIVKVDVNGYVYANKEGNASITVITDDGGFSDSCMVTIMKKLVTDIEISKTNADVLIDTTLQLTANVLPLNATDQKINWSSANLQIATVDDNGLVTTIALGEVDITATTNDGQYFAACKINVMPRRVIGVSLNRDSINIEVRRSQQLEAIILPDNATDKGIIWESSNDSIVMVNSKGLVFSRNTAGTATITATTKDGGFKATCKVNVIDLTSGIENVSTIETKIYPNPVKDILYIKTEQTSTNISIYDILGNKVKYFEKVKESISVYDLLEGIYIIEIQTNKGKFIRRFIKE